MNKCTLLAIFALFFGLSSQANDQVRYDCSNGNGDLELMVSPRDTRQIGVVVINASGVEDGSGNLNCTGPEQAAFSCSGEVSTPSPASGKFRIELVVAETVFQGYGGTAMGSQGVYGSYYCRPHAR